MYPNAPGYRPQPPSQGTAETLVLIAWIIQLILSVISILLGALLLVGGAILFLLPGAGAGLLALGSLLVAVPILMLYVGYEYSYRRIKAGDFAGARGATLLLGILGIFLGLLVVGILYIIAYVKVGDAETESKSAPAWSGFGAPPYGLGAPSYGYGAPTPGYAAPTGIYPGTPAGAPLAGGVAYAPPPAVAQTCPRCGRPATFIPQYGRSYCYNCAQYL